jgi:exodeoxyribonuclease V alpha subunit
METLDLITVLHSSHKGSREYLWRQEGSEYSAVIIPVLNPTLRNAVYTGLTRGKRLLLSVGRKKAITLAPRSRDLASRFKR